MMSQTRLSRSLPSRQGNGGEFSANPQPETAADHTACIAQLISLNQELIAELIHHGQCSHLDTGLGATAAAHRSAVITFPCRRL